MKKEIECWELFSIPIITDTGYCFNGVKCVLGYKQIASATKKALSFSRLFDIYAVFPYSSVFGVLLVLSASDVSAGASPLAVPLANARAFSVASGVDA